MNKEKRVVIKQETGECPLCHRDMLVSEHEILEPLTWDEEEGCYRMLMGCPQTKKSFRVQSSKQEAN